mgnify:CR=1 FL=1
MGGKKGKREEGERRRMSVDVGERQRERERERGGEDSSQQQQQLNWQVFRNPEGNASQKVRKEKGQANGNATAAK